MEHVSLQCSKVFSSTHYECTVSGIIMAHVQNMAHWCVLKLSHVSTYDNNLLLVVFTRLKMVKTCESAEIVRFVKVNSSGDLIGCCATYKVRIQIFHVFSLSLSHKPGGYSCASNLSLKQLKTCCTQFAIESAVLLQQFGISVMQEYSMMTHSAAN